MENNLDRSRRLQNRGGEVKKTSPSGEVYYLNEDGTRTGVVPPGGKYSGGFIDGVATKKYNDRIFKVPGWPESTGLYGDVTIRKNGAVDLDFYGFGDLLKALNMRAGWRTEEYLIQHGQYDYWKPLLDLAKTNF